MLCLCVERLAATSKIHPMNCVCQMPWKVNVFDNQKKETRNVSEIYDQKMPKGI